MKTFASLFTGFGGADLGAIQAGLTRIWGIEKDPDISRIASLNLHDKINQGDVREASFHRYWEFYHQGDNGLFWLHASPPCTTATIVNNKGESREDIELAQSVCRAIEALQPEVFSLENVEGYRYYKSFELIKEQLTANNYNCYTVILDVSGYGVPQSRKRLFLIASKNKKVWAWNERLKSVEKKVSWYDAIADLIPTLPECKLTESQKERLDSYFELKFMGCSTKELPKEVVKRRDSVFKTGRIAIQNSGSHKDKGGNPTNTIRLANEPIWTMRAMSGNVRVNPHQVTLIIDGKVLRPTVQCYARWQTFPDSYQFSGDFKLDMKGVGNAVPPLMFKQIVEAVLNG